MGARGRPAGKSISLEFVNDEDTIYTARAGLVPINEIAKQLKLPRAIDIACEGLRHDSYTDYKSSQLVMLMALGLLAGLYRVHHILSASELPFLARLVNLTAVPVATTIARFFERFDDAAIARFQAINFDLATKVTRIIDGFQILVHDQSALQKYGKKMEGVEKGYGGTLKRGSLMLQHSLIVDAGVFTALHTEIRPGSTHSFQDATQEMDAVLKKLPRDAPNGILVLADNAYGAGEYMRMCDLHAAHFILGVKNDRWMKTEMQELDFQRFKRGEANPDYGYREFVADRKAWNEEAPTPLFGDDWDGSRRIVVVRLPRPVGEPQKFLFLATTLTAETHSPEAVHDLYRVNREAIEQVNDEIQNQLGLAELPSRDLDANRAVAQVVTMAWNLQRHVEKVGMEKERKDEAIRRAKMKIEECRKNQRRFEWWTMFIRFIAVGGRLKTGKNRLVVAISQNQAMRAWLNALEAFDWSAYALKV